MLISEEQVREFEQCGAVTLHGPFSHEDITRANERMDELSAPNLGDGSKSLDTDEVLLNFVQHPALEEAAKQFLHADEVEFVAWTATQRNPQPDTPFHLESEHQDVRYSLCDLDAIPHRMLVTFLVWLTDVTMDRAPLMYRPASHRQVAAYISETESPSYRLCKVLNYSGENLPSLDYSEPQPILAKAGQVSVVTTSLIHSASSNSGTLPRRVLFISFAPKGMPVSFGNNDEQQVQYRNKLRALFRPERLHLLSA